MSKEYTGWKLFNNVIIVKSARTHYKYGCKQGYIVEPGNKKQLESAKHWGGMTTYETDDNGNYKKDEKGNYISHYEGAEIIETSNSGFKLTLLDCAGGSSQGGKLSFWNCLIEKDGDKYVVGINSELLLELMLQSTFTNGVCDKELCFARKSGNVGVLHEEMTQYKDAIKDMQIKKTINTKKTSKWQIGNNYVTLNNNDVYFGKLFQPIIYDHKYIQFSSINKEIRDKMIEANPEVHDRYCAYIVLETFDVDKLRASHVSIDNYSVGHVLKTKDLSSLTMKDYIAACRKLMEQDYLSWRKINNKELVHVNSNIAFNRGNLLGKLPSRTHGDIELGGYDDYYDDVEGVLHYQKNNLIKILRERAENVEFTYHILNEAIKSTNGDITELDVELISKIFELYCDDNSRYVLYKIVNNGVEEYLYTKEQVVTRLKELLQ